MPDSLILDSIPHRGSMLLVDEVVSISADEIVCAKTFRSDEFFFDGHYPNSPLVPGVILCECAAQTAAILLAKNYVSESSGENSAKVPVLARMNKVRFKNMVVPGNRIETTVRMDESFASAWTLTAMVRREGKLCASLELTCTLAPSPTSQSPS